MKAFNYMLQTNVKTIFLFSFMIEIESKSILK